MEPLDKHIVFVLDISGSMTGDKLEQLKNAMYTIIDQLQANDVFNIVPFSDNAHIWNIVSNSDHEINLSNYGHLADNLNVTIPNI